VHEAIAMSHLGSPATLQKRLALLRNLKLVDAVRLNGDHRTKFLRPSDKGLNEPSFLMPIALLTVSGVFFDHATVISSNT
jgi:hypothetical protein